MNNNIIKFYRNIKAWSVSIIPLLIVLLFAFIFKYHYLLLNIEGINIEGAIDNNYVNEFRHRTIWGLSSILLFMAVAINFAYSFVIIIKNLKRINKSMWLFLLVIIIMVAVLCALEFNDFDISGGAGEEMLYCLSENQKIKKISEFIDYSMKFSSACVLLITFSMLTILFRPKNSSQKDLKRRLVQFKGSVYFTTAFLAAGILQVFLLYRWAALSYDIIENEADRMALADSLAFSGSIIYTIVFLSMFIPVSIVLSNWSKKMAIANLETHDEEKTTEWLKINGLYRSPKQVFGNFLVLITPSLISLIFKVISN